MNLEMKDPRRLEVPLKEEDIQMLIVGLMQEDYEARRLLRVNVNSKESKNAQEQEPWLIVDGEDALKEVVLFLRWHGEWGRKYLLRNVPIRIEFERAFAKKQGFLGYVMRRRVIKEYVTA